MKPKNWEEVEKLSRKPLKDIFENYEYELEKKKTSQSEGSG